MRMFVEFLHLLAGIVATWAIVMCAAWAYPLGRDTLYVIGWIVSGIVILMAVGPMRRAWIADNARRG